MMQDPTRVMHLPPGAPAPRREIPASHKKVPFLRTIIVLFMIDMALWAVTVMYWLINWEDIWA